ncbi:hypothetical protein [Noviherbaspirillum sp.]|uniref:hypothetical protein n=1 Tax=Noviherbaspirillum sp. TaxID=1926288 RepID=UPI002B46AAF6|nr:hypothetical protein [Noviherbaspirillum sp.]HJV80046.1 hypothetical protein [Noviherbaspirillum sp.]
MKISVKLAAAVLALAAHTAWAGNLALFGLELGVATLDNVQKEIGAKTRLVPAGTNRYTRGPMLSGPGKGIDVEGLSEIVFIFDTARKLNAVVMYFPNGEGSRDGRIGTFRKAMNGLAARYTLVEKRIASGGDAYARFKHGNAVIELDAPRYDFDMTLRYITGDLQDAFIRQTGSTPPAKGAG